MLLNETQMMQFIKGRLQMLFALDADDATAKAVLAIAHSDNEKHLEDVLLKLVLALGHMAAVSGSPHSMAVTVGGANTLSDFRELICVVKSGNVPANELADTPINTFPSTTVGY